MGKIDNFGSGVVLLVLWQRGATLGAALREYHRTCGLLMMVIATSYTQKQIKHKLMANKKVHGCNRKMND